MTSGIHAGEALWRNFWRGDHGGAIQRGAISHGGRAGTFQHRQFGGEHRSQTPDILAGASQRIDILTGRPVD